MANKSLRFCLWPGCNSLCKDAYCETHQVMMDAKRAEEKRRYQKGRPSPRKIGYDSNWDRCRAAYLAKSPLCEICLAEGKVTPAVLVHHKKRLVENGARLDPDNLQSVCQFHHSEIHKGDRWR